MWFLKPDHPLRRLFAGLTEQIFRRAREQYGGNAQSTQVVKLLEDALHTDLRAPGFPAELV